MKHLFTIFILTLVTHSSLLAQSHIPWDAKYEVQLSDFRSPTTQIGESNTFTLYSGAGFDFTFQMTNAEFMFTKNFNSRVNCRFDRDIASIIAPDSARAMDFVKFARYDFDLCELYARKVRQRLYEEKGTFSSPSFFQPVFDEFQKEYAQRRVTAGNVTALGGNREKLEELHVQVKREIEALTDFCRECKPAKKKKVK